jgi:hypothetical protein
MRRKAQLRAVGADKAEMLQRQQQPARRAARRPDPVRDSASLMAPC